MYFFPDAELEAILSEDVPYGDLTSRLLGLEKAEGAVECFFRGRSRGSGTCRTTLSQGGAHCDPHGAGR